jgi:hypothetical protein
MNKNNHGTGDINPPKLVGMMMLSLPSLLFRLTGTFIRLKSSANKAGKIFHSELLKQGIDQKTANDLTSEYMQSSHFREYLKGFNQ